MFKLVKNLPKFDKKMKRENEDKLRTLIDNKPSKLNEKTRRKTDYLMFCTLLG